MKEYKGVLFDLDGTLIDSLYDIADAMNHVLKVHHYPIYEYDAYRFMVGKGLKNLTCQALPQGTSDEICALILEEMIAYYQLHLIDKTVLYPGIADLLDALIERNYKIVVYSNKADQLVQLIARFLLSRWNIDIVRGATDEMPRKPDPTGALFLAGQLDLSPSDFLYLGDTNVDMETANRAGMFAVGVTWGFRSEKELREAGAKRIINYPMELLK